MKQNFELALTHVLAHEGGFVNHPKDPGGATNMGITIGTLSEFTGQKCTVEDVRHIPFALVAQIYRQRYWDAVCGNELPSGLDYAVFDFAVNSGPARAIRFLQSELGLNADGVMGPKTLQRAWAVDAVALIGRYMASRSTYLQALRTYKTFGKGWDRRVKGVATEARNMAIAAEKKKIIVQAATRKPAYTEISVAPSLADKIGAAITSAVNALKKR